MHFLCINHVIVLQHGSVAFSNSLCLQSCLRIPIPRFLRVNPNERMTTKLKDGCEIKGMMQSGMYGAVMYVLLHSKFQSSAPPITLSH